MLRSGRKFVTTQATMKTLALAIGIWLAYHGTAAGAACELRVQKEWETKTVKGVVAPEPADRQAIMDLIARYNWALDDKKIASFRQLFTKKEPIFYEVCDAKNKQTYKATNLESLAGRIQMIFEDQKSYFLQTRRFVSNTLLHKVDEATVLGQATLLVTIQSGSAYALAPTNDYTAVLRARFRTNDHHWTLETVTVDSDTPEAKPTGR